MDSSAFKHLHAATGDILGESKPYSITGSLPLVGDLQKEGFDIQICGYGHSSVYHGDNEYCSLSAMENAFKILYNLIEKYNQWTEIQYVDEFRYIKMLITYNIPSIHVE